MVAAAHRRRHHRPPRNGERLSESGGNRSAPPGRFHFNVLLFRAGPLDGTPRAETGSELRWARPAEIDPHPNLAVALADLGLIERDPGALRRDLAKAGLEMRRVF